MKICYVGNFRNISVGENEVAYALEQCGHEVRRVQERAGLDEVRDAVRNCDLLLFAKFRSGKPSEVEQFLKECRVPKICWIWDLYFGL